MTLDRQHWQDRLEALASKHGVVGATLAVMQGEETVEAATGVLNVRTQQPVTPDSVFQVGSITKVWTATLVMQLVDEGLLDLDEPVAKHLPGFRVADEQVSATVTARQLLAHTSGIDGDLFLDTGRGDDALERYVEAMSGLTQVHPLGATMSYCNSGYSLLGRLVEVLRGKTWDEVVKERLVAPLGLAAGGTFPEEALLWGAATGHTVVEGEPQVVPQWGIFRSCGPAGLLHMTARDQLAFVRLHLSGGVTPDGTRLLSEASVAAMQERQVEVPDPYTLGSHWGLGWILDEVDGKQVVAHDGTTLGQNAFLRIVPEAGVAVSLLTNGGGVRDLYEDLFTEVLSATAGITLPASPQPTGETVTEHERFVGTYVREGVEITVRPDDDGGLQLLMKATGPLAASRPEPEPVPLRPFDGDVLLTKMPAYQSWFAAVFFDLDGERYVHLGARATRRVSTDC
ncbi:MAG: beta-lactamase [Frankiales bacterium]|nr:beta-lactamase [Frankiales bacterium]